MELWGLRDGLLQCLNLNLSFVLIELDAKSIVDLLVNSDYSNNAISPLVDRDGNFCLTRGYSARPDPNGPGFIRSD